MEIPTQFDVLFFISQGLSILTMIASIVSSQMKKMTHILLLQIIGSLPAALSYILLDGGESGFVVTMIGVVQAIVMYIYDKKKKAPHVIVTIGFIVAFVSFSLYGNADKLINYLPAAAAVCFVLAITQRKPKMYRIFIFINAVLWLVYDVCILSGNFIVHLSGAIAGLIGMIRLDGLFGLIKQKEPKNE